jgi:RimJ/RimL family protein N-acetyltransferase
VKNIQIEKLSGAYTIRRLTDADVPMLYAWMLRNDQYFRYCGGSTTPERVRQDLTLCPPGTTPAQKHYVGFFGADTLVAVMDLIDGYPDADTAFIGFFMMNKDLQGQGTGTAIVREVLAALRALGYTAVRLGIDKENPQSNHFWRKNGFAVLREAAQERGIVLLAERRLA